MEDGTTLGPSDAVQAALNLEKMRKIALVIHAAAEAAAIDVEAVTETLARFRQWRAVTVRAVTVRKTRVRRSVRFPAEKLDLATLVSAYNKHEYDAMIADSKKFKQFEKILLAFFQQSSQEECLTQKPWAVIEV